MDKYIDIIARLYSLAIDFKMNPDAISERIIKSEIIRDIERRNYCDLDNNTFRSISYFLFPEINAQDDYLFNYDRGYWCGYVYMSLFYELKKPISYIILKLPLKELMEMYDVYHEMDISFLFEYFKEIENRNTIIEIILDRYNLSVTKLSKESNVPLRTIKNFKKDDENLYKGTFLNVHRIALALDLPDNLFLKTL